MYGGTKMKYIDDVLRIFRTIRIEKRKVRAIGVIFCISILLISGVSAAIVTQEKEKPEERYRKSNELLEINTERDITFFPDISNDKNSSFIGNTGFSPWYYYIGDIINSANGNLYIALKDISIKGRGFNLEIIRSYNSYNQNHSSGYGYGWTFNYHTYVIDYLGYVIWVDGDGSYHNFTHLGGGVYSAPAGIFERLTKNADKTFTIRSKDGMVYDFNTIGQIVTVSDKNDNSLTFTYDGAKLLQVKDDSEMYLNFSYNAKHLICMVEDPAGRKILYEYDVYKNLKRVTDAKGNSTRYLYRCCHRLSCLIDRANTSILFSYDDAGYRVHDIRNAVYDSQEQVFHNPFVVFLLAFDDVNYSTYYVTSNNYAWLVKYNTEGNPLEVIDPRNGTKKYTWDDNLITSYTDENGNTDTYEYDSYGNVKNHFNAFSYKTLHDWKTMDKIDSYLSVVENISKISYEPGTQTYLLNDDVDPPSSNWFPSPMWIPWVGVYHSPVTSWSCGEATMFYGDGWNEMLDYKYLNLSGYTDVELSFWHKGDFDGDPSVGYMPDGGNVKISTDGGNNWTILFPEGGYDGKLAFGNGNPLEVERAFGYIFNWKQEKIDLSSYVGMADNVSIRFNMGTDMYPSMHKGWYIDDIVVMGYIANERKITTSFFYDEKGNLEEIKDTLGNSSYYDYDAFGNVISETDFRGNTTVYTYDTHGNMISVTDPTQNTSRYTYDGIGRMINFTDANGYSTLYTYDENNNILNITDATGNSTIYVYNANDAKISEIDALGRWTNLTQNVVGEVEQEVDPSGETTYYKYDHDGRFYESTDSKGNTRSAERDPMGRITSVTDAFGYTEWYGYDAKGNVVYYMDKNNAITHYEYDKLNRLMRIIDPYNSEYKYKYDELGNVIELNDENDNSIYYEYDDLNRVIKMEGPGCCGSGTKLFEYDENGNRIKFCDANGYTTTYIYDALNSQTGVLDAE
jgi:YD repeat-containing protein